MPHDVSLEDCYFRPPSRRRSVLVGFGLATAAICLVVAGIHFLSQQTDEMSAREAAAIACRDDLPPEKFFGGSRAYRECLDEKLSSNPLLPWMIGGLIGLVMSTLGFLRGNPSRRAAGYARPKRGDLQSQLKARHSDLGRSTQHGVDLDQ
jgi:hypothetical protein